MFKLRDFKCSKCGKVFEDLTRGLKTRCHCGGKAKAIHTIRKIAVHGCESFNPHFDDQVGQWFESKEHKEKVLKELGKKQVSGHSSPRGSNKTSIKMTMEQAKKFDPSYAERIPRLK